MQVLDNEGHDSPSNIKPIGLNKIKSEFDAPSRMEGLLNPQPTEQVKRSEEEQEMKEEDSQVSGRVSWTEEEDKNIFVLYKIHGSKWARIAKEFKDKTDNQVKNRFYSTLRRVATKKNRDNPCRSFSSDQLGKTELLQYVDDAYDYGHTCSSKRGRKKKKLANITTNIESCNIPPMMQTPILQPMLGSIMPSFSYPIMNLQNNFMRPMWLPNCNTFYPHESLQDPSTNNFQRPGINLEESREEIMAKLYHLSALEQNLISLLNNQSSFPPSRASSSGSIISYPLDRKENNS